MALPVREAPANESFARFHDAYAHRVRGLARHLLGNHASVDDVVQETLWRAYRKGLHYDGERDPWPWLATVVRNACHDVHRSQRAWIDVGEADAAAPATESVVVDSARRSYVVDTLERLPERQRRLLLLRHVDGVHCDAIAGEEGSSVDAVKSALARARDAFRSRYEGWRGMLPLGLGPIVVRARAALGSSTSWLPTPRTGLAGVLTTLLALGWLAPSEATGPGEADSAGIGPGARTPVELHDQPISETSVTPAGSSQFQPEGGARVASPPPTRRDALPAPGPALDSSDGSDPADGGAELPLPGLTGDADLPGAEEVVSAAEASVGSAVETVTDSVETVTESVDDTVDDVTDPLL